MCDNILAYLPYAYAIFTTQELSANPLYDPNDNKPWWELAWNAICDWFAGIAQWFSSIDVGWKIGIGIALFAVAIILTFMTNGATATAVPALAKLFIGFVVGVVGDVLFTAISTSINGDFKPETLLNALANGILFGGIFAFVSAGVNFIKFNKAKQVSFENAVNRAKEWNAHTGKKPTMTSVAVDYKSGKIYYGDSGTISNNINTVLAKQMPKVSTTPWSVANCAEFNAVNNALNSGAKIRNLVVTTVRVRTLEMAPMCTNCQISLKGVLLVVSR